MRPTLNSLALAKWAVSLFSSRAAALVSHVSRLRRSRARALLSLNLKKKRDCSQSIHWEKVKNSWPKDSNVSDVSARGIRKDGGELPVEVT